MEPTSKNRTLLTVGVAVVITALLSGGATYAVLHKKNTDSKASLQTQIDTLQSQLNALKTTSPSPSPTVATATPTPSATASPTATATPAISTAGWKTYTDSTYALSFLYPPTWGTSSMQAITETKDSPWWEFTQHDISFPSKTGILGYVSTFNSYRNSENATVALKDSITQLVSVYTSRSAASASAFWLPPDNASINFHTTPQYIESSNGKYRGVYYYAQIAQYAPATVGGANPLGELIAVLTDGSSKIFQIHDLTYNNYAAITDATGYQSVSECVNSKNVAATCIVNKQTVHEFESELKAVLLSVQ
jgi:outer membrane murein-binding lipoprotein Lpp